MSLFCCGKPKLKKQDPTPTLASPSVHIITFDPIPPVEAIWILVKRAGPRAVDPK